jgi:hypothetical protein
MQLLAPIIVNFGMGGVTTMRAPKFCVGQAVVYFPPRGVSAQRGAYSIIAELPMRSGLLGYRIKHQFEEYDRVATESDLSVLWN